MTCCTSHDSVLRGLMKVKSLMYVCVCVLQPAAKCTPEVVFKAYSE